MRRELVLPVGVRLSLMPPPRAGREGGRSGSCLCLLCSLCQAAWVLAHPRSPADLVRVIYSVSFCCHIGQPALTRTDFCDHSQVGVLWCVLRLAAAVRFVWPHFRRSSLAWPGHQLATTTGHGIFGVLVCTSQSLLLLFPPKCLSSNVVCLTAHKTGVEKHLFLSSYHNICLEKISWLFLLALFFWLFLTSSDFLQSLSLRQ